MFLKPQCYNPSTDVVDSLSETTTLVLSVIADLCLLRPKSITADFVVLITDWRKDSKTIDKRLPREYYLVGENRKIGCHRHTCGLQNQSSLNDIRAAYSIQKWTKYTFLTLY